MSNQNQSTISSARPELIKKLKDFPWWQQWVCRARNNVSNCGLESIIKQSVGANVFRAFPHLPRKPSEIYRDWAYNYLISNSPGKQNNNNIPKCFYAIKTRSEYRKWAYQSAKSLRDKWSREMKTDMHFGPSLKIINLLAKRLCLSNEITCKESYELSWIMDVPLDYYVIIEVKKIIETNCPLIGIIPSRPTMNFIKNKQMYECFQNEIYSLTKDAGVPPIALDYFAWNKPHGLL